MAGRSVGNIEVTVDADTGRLVAQLTRAGTKAGQAAKKAAEKELRNLQATIDFQTQEATNEAKILRKRIEAQLAGIELEVDIREAQRDIAALEAQADNTDLILNAQLSPRDIAAINRNLREMRMVAESDAINLRIELEDAAAKAKLEARRAELEAQSDEINMRLEVDDIFAKAQMEAFRERQEADPISVPVVIDESGVDASALDGGGSGLSARWKAIIGGIIVLAEPLAVALQGVLGGAVAVLSSAFNALAGSMGAAIPIGGSLIGVVGALVVGFQGMGDALGEVTEQMDSQLAPAAQEFVSAFALITDELTEVRVLVQQRLFAGLSEELSDLANTAIPSVGEALGLAADSLNSFFRQLSDAAQDMDFAGMFDSIQPALDAVLSAAVTLFRTIEPFFEAAAPAAEMLGESLRDAANSLRQMITAGAGSGGLTRFLEQGVESLQMWWELIRNVGDALFTLFQAGASTGNSLIQTLSDIVGQFDAWMESAEGQEVLLGFFESTREVLSSMTPILQGLVGFFDNLVTPEAIGRFGDLSDSLGRILPVLGSVLELVGRTRILNTLAEALALVAEAIEPIIPDLQVLADEFGRFGGELLKAIAPALPPLARALGDVAVAITPLVEAVGRQTAKQFENLVPLIELFALALEQLAAALKVANPVLTTMFNIVSALLNLPAAGLGFLAEQLMRIPTALGLVETDIAPVDKGMVKLDKTFVDAAASASAFEQRLAASGATSGVITSAIDNVSIALFGVSAGAAAAGRDLTTIDTATGRLVTSSVAAATSLNAIESAATLAAGAADTLRSQLDLLLSPTLDAQAASDAYQQALDDLTASIEENGLTLDESTEKGRANRAQIRDNVTSITDWAAAQIEAGASAQETAAAAGLMREALINQIQPFFDNRDAAAAYIDQLGLTPEIVETEVATPGLDESKLGLIDFENKAAAVDAMAVDVPVTASGLANAIDDVSTYQSILQELDGKVVEVQILQRGLDNISDSGGQVGPMGSIGSVAGPELVRFPGDAQRTLMPVPSLLPPGSMVTSVAGTRALLGELATSSGTVIQRQINLYQTFQLTSADPEAVAVQAVNRAASLANI